MINLYISFFVGSKINLGYMWYLPAFASFSKGTKVTFGFCKTSLDLKNLIFSSTLLRKPSFKKPPIGWDFESTCDLDVEFYPFELTEEIVPLKRQEETV